MDPQAPIEEPVVPAQIPNSNPKTPSNPNGITIASMALFVLMSLTVIIFLYYQNQQLKNIVASYQTPFSSPTPTPTMTVLETASPSASPKIMKPSPTASSLSVPVSTSSAVPKAY